MLCNLYRASDMATIQVLFLGFILLVYNVETQGFPTNIKGMLPCHLCLS